MDSETPFEGPMPDDGDDAPYEWLDEWLCEYVDGTMDPSLEAVFEQYVEANPELKAHVERLQQTRDLLCECGLPREPSADLEAEICTEVECDMMQSSASVSETVRDRPFAAFGVASSIAVALVVGFLVGATMVDPVSSPFPPSATSVEQRVPDYSRTPSLLLRRTQAPTRERPLLRPSAPFSTVDSTARSPLTTIGLP